MSADTVVFTFEGKQLTARPGVSIAAALAAHGVHTLGRSVKYHRPRGYTCGFSACGDCPLTVNGLPGVESCSREVAPGDEVSRELGWPSASFDLLRVADLVARWIPAGFQFRLFTRAPRLSRASGRVLKNLAGGGRFPTVAAARASQAVDVRRVDADVVVVGAGVSGLQSARVAAAAGRSVVLVERPAPTRRAEVRTEPVIGMDGAEVTRAEALGELRDAVAADTRIGHVTGTVFGVMDGLVLVDSGATRWEITPGHLVVATGSYETTPLFRGNDRPGIHLADGALKLRRESGRPLGRRVVVATDSDRGHAVAAALRNAGDTVVRVLDTRSTPGVEGRADGLRSGTDAEYGIELAGTRGWGRVSAVVYRRENGDRGVVRADALVLAFARRPADELVLQTEYHDEEAVGAPPLTVVGSASGADRTDLHRTATLLRDALAETSTSPSAPSSAPPTSAIPFHPRKK
ncbi:2Fe-2S iron-sulfur cluster-binding protein [Herbiconiux sp. KACC 21604]|uniref:2Fe-2S iron-sulfur cluster-binding protein n=1 Tax=unclassified Herbiconiux TaxID=2618217 RepID=UPI0014915B65|nr:2Fe-2S iron-sulfur cluster-binding protein [Herbiconiux sp. SALV-R1]QJU55677.1 FAD-dependent oxidoreductase [Herbiconiux sp. SALV-R1]WPO86880.1 2Fe-2S iron-sulfur cluster-binding protein [Herbiconiux sp. KACC 21604]